MVAGDPLEHPWVLPGQGLAAVVSQQALALDVGMIKHDQMIQMMKWWNAVQSILASELCTERLLRLGVGATTTRPSSHLLTWNPLFFLMSGFLVENEWE